MPTTSRPTKPKSTLFYGKNIVSRALPKTFKLSAAEKADGSPGDPQIAITFQIGKDQRATYYSVGAGMPATVREGDFALVQEGTTITLIASLSPAAAAYTVDKLRAAGWAGKSFQSLLAGQYDGLGDVDCNLTIEVEEVDNRDGNWRMKEGENGVQTFDPRMRISFVNKFGGFNFKKEGTVDDAKALDAKLADILNAADPRSMAPKKSSAASNPNGSSGNGQEGAPAPVGAGDEIPF